MSKAIVLGGGGGLGAYQAGVFRYLCEIGYEYDLVTGTSIGAINGAFFSYSNPDHAEAQWRKVTPERIYRGGINIPTDFFQDFSQNGQKRKALMKIVRQRIGNHGLDITPLREWVAEAIDPQSVHDSAKRLGISTCVFPAMREEQLIMQDVDVDLILPYIHASSACWPVFPLEKIGKYSYADGGWRNNVPIDMALSMGANDILVVSLFAWPHFLTKREYYYLPGLKMIMPFFSLGSPANFSPEIIDARIRRGYLDAKRLFGEIEGVGYSFRKGEFPERKALRMASIAFKDNSSKPLVHAMHELIKPDDNPFIDSGNLKTCYYRLYEVVGYALGLDFVREWTLDEFRAEIKRRIEEAEPKKKYTGKVKDADMIDYLRYLYMMHMEKKDIPNLIGLKKRNPITIAALLIFDELL